MGEREEFVHFPWPEWIAPPIWYANKQWAVTAQGVVPLVEGLPIYARGFMYRTSDGILANAASACGHTLVDVDEFLDACNQAVQLHRIKGRTIIDWTATRSKCLRSKQEAVYFSEICSFLGVFDGASEDDVRAAHELFLEQVQTAKVYAEAHTVTQNLDVSSRDLSGARYSYLGPTFGPWQTLLDVENRVHSTPPKDTGE